MSELPYFILTILFGACVGSFLNVVAYRLPLGKSLVHPGSRCPGCDTAIAWYDNLPVIGWIKLRGRCRNCQIKISVRYPIIEAITAAMFGVVFAVYYFTNLRGDFWTSGLIDTWPVLIVHLVLVACLIAATLIDAEHFIIPLQIPWTTTIVAIIGLPVSMMLCGLEQPAAPVPQVGAAGALSALGGGFGLLIAIMLLHLRIIPRSFDEPIDETKTVAEDVLSYEHPRREICKEMLFVIWPMLGLAIGWWLGRDFTGVLGPFYRVLGGVVLGYFAGAALVWGVRILGTLAFGKEAMGLGDVHLWGAVGCVIGAVDATVAFFIAPFFGLAAVVVSMGVAAAAKGEVRVIPYGPFLAAAAYCVMLFREPILAMLSLS